MTNTLQDIISQINNHRGLLWTEEDKQEFTALLIKEFCEIAHCNSHTSGIELGRVVCETLNVEII